MSESVSNQRPIIEIEIVKNSARQLNPEQISPRSGPIDEIKYKSTLEWEYNVIIRNNSSQTAYNVELEYPMGQFDHIDNLNPNKPIPATGEVVLSAKYHRLFEGTNSEMNIALSHFTPENIYEIQILSKYKDEGRDLDYSSLFTFSKNKFPQQQNKVIKPPILKRYRRSLRRLTIGTILVAISGGVGFWVNKNTLFDKKDTFTINTEDYNSQILEIDSTTTFYIITQKIEVSNNSNKNIFIHEGEMPTIAATAVSKNGSPIETLQSYFLDESYIEDDETSTYCNAMSYLKNNHIYTTGDTVRCNEKLTADPRGGRFFAGENALRPSQKTTLYLTFITMVRKEVNYICLN